MHWRGSGGVPHSAASLDFNGDAVSFVIPTGATDTGNGSFRAVGVLLLERGIKTITTSVTVEMEGHQQPRPPCRGRPESEGV